MSPSWYRRSSTWWVAAKTSGAWTWTPISVVTSKNRRQFSSVAAARQSASS